MIIFAFYLLLGFSQKSEFLVLNVKGTVQVKGRPAFLHKGDKLSENDKLQFISAGSTVSIISPGKGRMELTESVDGRAGSKRNGELYYEVITLLKPAKQQVITAGRDAIILDEQQFSSWLMQITRNENPLLVIDSLLVPMGSHFTNNGQASFFLATYYYKNERIDKKIPIYYNTEKRQAKLSISDDLITVDGQKLPISYIEELSWYYYNSAGKTAIPLGKSSVRFATRSSLESEFCALKSSLEALNNQHDKDQFLSAEFYSYLFDYYGSSTMECIKSAIKNNSCK